MPPSEYAEMDPEERDILWLKPTMEKRGTFEAVEEAACVEKTDWENSF
jgi:hypothetical protein